MPHPVALQEGITVLVGPPGGSAQRNTAIHQVPLDVRYTAFFDDDVEVHPSYLENAITFLEKNPDVVAISGILLADGNISREKARALLDQDETWKNRPSKTGDLITYFTSATRSSEPDPCGQRCSTKICHFTVMAKIMIFPCASRNSGGLATCRTRSRSIYKP